MSLIKSLAGQTVIYGLGHILPRVLHFIVFNSYLTYRWNDQPLEYAIYLDLYAYASVLIILFSLRMDTGMFRFGRKMEDLENTYATAQISLAISAIFLIGLGYLMSDPLATILTYPGKGYYVEWFALIIAFDVLSVIPYARYRLENKAKTFVSFKIANVLITVFLVFLFLEVIPGFYPGYVSDFSFIQSEVDLVFLSNLIASFVIMITISWKNLPQKWSVDWTLWRKMIKYTWPLIIVGIAGSINQFFAVPLQKFFLGEAIEINKGQAAIYGAVQKLAGLLAMFTAAYNYAAEPFFFRNADREDMRRLYGNVALFFVLAAGVLALTVLLFIDVFQLIIGSHFRQGLYLLPVLLMAYVFLGLYYNVSIWYKLSDKTGYGAVIATIGSIITLAGSIIFLPVFGVDASAWTALVCYIVMVFLAYFLGQKHYAIDYNIRRIILHIAILVTFMALSLFVRQDEILYNLLIGAILLGLYLLIIITLEKRLIREYLL